MKAAAALVAVSLAVGQSTAPRYRSGIEVVTVDVLVTQGGRAVSGLRANDFELRDNGIVQEIDSVTVDETPVSMLLALDTSNSVEGATLSHLKRAAIAAVDSLTKDDRAAVLTFADSVTLRADWSTPSTAMRDAIAAATARGATSLYDAAYAALTLKDNRPGRRSFVLLFSDGGDTSSWLPARAVMERARRSDAVVLRRGAAPAAAGCPVGVQVGYRALDAGYGLSGGESRDARGGEHHWRPRLHRGTRRRAHGLILRHRDAVPKPLRPHLPAARCGRWRLARDRSPSEEREGGDHRAPRLHEVMFSAWPDF